MAGHLLRDFEFTPVLQVRSDSGGAEAVAADACCDAGGKRASLNHDMGVGLR